MTKLSYGEKLNKIDSIIEEIQTGDLDMDKIDSQLSAAKKMLESCKKQLFNTEEKISKIMED